MIEANKKIGISAGLRAKLADVTPAAAAEVVRTYGDRQVAQQEVNALQEQGMDIYVSLGFGLGYHAEFAAKRFRCPVLVFEPRADVVAAALADREIDASNVLIVDDWASLVHSIISRLMFSERKIAAAAVGPYRTQFPELLAEFESKLNEANRASQVHENTIRHRTKGWIDNTLQNIPDLVGTVPVVALAEAFAGKPGILVSAGPSLDRNIKYVRAAKGRALIVAVNAAVRPLLVEGVSPDLAVAVEGIDVTEHLRDYDGWLVHTTYAHPKFSNWEKRLPLLENSAQLAGIIHDAYGWPMTNAGGSVANTAMAIMALLGCDPIVLVGQDLAYTGGKSYPSTATFGAQPVTIDGDSIKLGTDERLVELRTSAGMHKIDEMALERVTAYGGDGEVETSAMLSSFRQSFETAAVTWASNRTLINATEGGARIEGFDEMSLYNALEKYASEDIEIDIGGLVDGHDVADADSLHRALTTAASDLDEIVTLAREAAVAADSILQQIGSLKSHESKIRSGTEKTSYLNTWVAATVPDLKTGYASIGETERVEKHLTMRSDRVKAVMRCSEELAAMLRKTAARVVSRSAKEA